MNRAVFEPLADHRGPLTVEDDFLVLDDAVEQADFTQPVLGDAQGCLESVLMVQGMYCAACADTVESSLQGVPGVRSAQVHAATRRLVLQWDPAQTPLSRLAQMRREGGGERERGKSLVLCCYGR
jgi:Cu2+-exporting ATPase